MKPFLEQDDPDPQEIGEHYVPSIRADMRTLFEGLSVEPALRNQLIALGDRLIDLRRADMLAAAAWHIPALADEFPQAMGWLTFNHQVYFQMTELLWRLRGWLREFMLAYLARHFRVAVFGGDWGALGCAKPGNGWVDLADMPKVLARGKVVVNLSAGYDEEGITAKPFEIAASGACMVHNRCRGLEDFFTIGSEVESFHRPREARDAIAALLADDSRRRSIGAAARARVERDHSWDSRLQRLLTCAGLTIDSFRA
jgi:glycosyltransferase involved in cell wall biosynthesis